ncbi:MAG: hypothetical protein EOM32_08555 [Spirochaetia bacterium]|nr:hypothetical protein [Sphaerochaeta sp.]NCC13408.1 hypothetical protein [Spirochaetia bacterium]NCC89606.1 hypothetical protein [Spirochaetia bacterium]
MKRVLLVLLLVALALVPATAAERASKTDLALGLNLGTSASIAAQYRMDSFDLIANIGFGFLNEYLSAEVAANFKVAEFKIENADFDITVAGGAYFGIPLASDSKFGFAAIAPIGLVYSFSNSDAPIDLYLRVTPGLWIVPAFDVYYDGYVGAMWRFD